MNVKRIKCQRANPRIFSERHQICFIVRLKEYLFYDLLLKCCQHELPFGPYHNVFIYVSYRRLTLPIYELIVTTCVHGRLIGQHEPLLNGESGLFRHC